MRAVVNGKPAIGEIMVTREQVLEALKECYDPEIPLNIVDLGLVTEDDITVTDNGIEVAYGLTAPMCPFSAAIGLVIKYALEKKLGVAVSVNLRAGHHQEGVVAELLTDSDMYGYNTNNVGDKCLYGSTACLSTCSGSRTCSSLATSRIQEVAPSS